MELHSSGLLRSLDSRLFKMGQVGFPETSIRNDHYTLRDRSEVLALRLVFCTDLRRESDFCFIQHYLTSFYNRGEKCLQRGTDSVFK